MKIFLVIFYLLSASFSWGEEKPGEKYLVLYQGVEHEETLAVLPVGGDFGGDWKGITKLAVAREYQKLRFTPIKPGVATLSIHDKKGTKLFEYRIEVRDSTLTKTVREVRSLLSDIEGISVKILNDKVVIDGKVVHPEDLNRVVAVTKQYRPDMVSSLVEVSPFAQQKIAEIIEREVNNPDVQVRARNGKYVLTGEVNSTFEKDNAELIARTYLPPLYLGEAEADGTTIKKRKDSDPIINLIVTRPPPDPQPKKLIQLVLHYVELNKTYANSSRFQWTPTVGDTTNISFTQDSRQPSGVISSITGTISNLLPKLNWAKAHGYARILETTSVITKQDVAGVVTQRTTIPYITQNQLGAAVPGQAEVSLISNITPTIDNPRSDLIGLKMTFNIGSLVSVTSVGPIISNNSVTTEVQVRSGESAAVAGLIRTSQTMDYNKVPPGLQNALFSFYNSKDFQKNQSQFVVFVTPVIKSSASSGVDKVKEKFRLTD